MEMTWEAANVDRAKRDESSSNPNKRKANETVEAALSRLTKAYSTSLSCIGILHKLHANLNKEPERRSEFERQCQRLSEAARSTFEKAIFLDPLISNIAPTWEDAVKKFATSNPEKWSFVLAHRPPPPVLTSQSQWSTVSELAYLSLLNYSDLLIASQDPLVGRQGILENGVVKPLPMAKKGGADERRLALVALCDASHIQDSDPVMWLKLACAARGLSRSLSNGPDEPLKYKRLELYALERGKTALPPNMPVNRSILKALKEHNELPQIPRQSIPDEPTEIKLGLELPRYSWSILGRMLMRACREGFKTENQIHFGSPSIELKISPMLILTPKPLGSICCFLENNDVWNFEATCRALYASVVSARASLERRQGLEQADDSKESKENEEEQQEQIEQHAQAPTDTGGENTNQEQTAAGNSNTDQDLTNTEPANRPSESEPVRSSRSSKRVRSQLISSGRRSERESKRNSIGYCLTASTLHMLPEDVTYRRLSNILSPDWDGLICSRLSLSSFLPTEAKKTVPIQSEQTTHVSRLGDSCLTVFIAKCNARNAGPFDVLRRYVAHVALHVEDVFGGEQDLLALGSFFTDCLDLLANRQGAKQWLDPFSLGHVSLANLSTQPEKLCLEFFAVCLLNAELRLKRSDSFQWEDLHLDTDETLVQVAISDLLEAIAIIETQHFAHVQSVTWLKLKTRYYWLAACYFFERSRATSVIAETRNAENRGVEQVKKAIECLRLPEENSIGSVHTPHLSSPRRVGAHWKILNLDSLTAFLSEIQASSVVSTAKEKFEAHVHSIGKTIESPEVNEPLKEDIDGLKAVGTTLIERYNVKPEDNEAERRLRELLEDFLGSAEGEFVRILGRRPKGGTDDREQRWGLLWNLIRFAFPEGLKTLVELHSPSVLTILLSCIAVGDMNKLTGVFLLTRLARTAYAIIISESAQSSAGKAQGGSSDYFSDEDSFSDFGIASSDQSCDWNNQKRDKDGRKILVLAKIAEFLVDKICQCFNDFLSKEERDEYIQSEEFLCLICSGCEFVSNWHDRRSRNSINSQDASIDVHSFSALRRLCHFLVASNVKESQTERAGLAYFLGLCRILTTQRKAFESVLLAGSDRTGRVSRQRECLARAELIAAAASELASIMSLNMSFTTNQLLRQASLISSLKAEQRRGDNTELSQNGFLGYVIEAAHFLWLRISNKAQPMSGWLERIYHDELSVPTSALIIGLCGSAVRSCRSGESTESKASLRVNEFFESDASANDSDSDEDEQSKDTALLMKPYVCLALHCVTLAYTGANERMIPRTILAPKTPLLPMITVRVLSYFSDMILREFGNKGNETENIWAETYPYGFREIGSQLDDTLHKAYRYLYGFTIIGHWTNQDKEKASTSTETTLSFRQPESTLAASQLYRCIRRAYDQTRKTPPKSALEAVTRSLPQTRVSQRGKIISDFIFKQDNGMDSCEMRGVPENAWHQQMQLCHNSIEDAIRSDVEPPSETFLLRQRLFFDLAEGPIPSISDASKATKRDEDGRLPEERINAAHYERELAKKFKAIIEDLSYGDPFRVERWTGAADCLRVKADVIADRLGLSAGFLRVSDFKIDSSTSRSHSNRKSLSDLRDFQHREEKDVCNNWLPFMGEDWSLFVDFQWSSFKSLQQFFETLTSNFRQMVQSKAGLDGLDDNAQLFLQAQALKEIKGFLCSGDFIKWQQSLGGLFVSTLRQMASRCYHMAHFILHKNESRSREILNTKADLMESIGVFKFSGMLGSQVYGYPMHIMTAHRKRQLSETALSYFSSAVEVTTQFEDPHNQVTYDLLFMIGKCYEKIGCTFMGEEYINDESQERLYEQYMEKALSQYSSALQEAQSLEKEGALPEVQAGGSSHGVTEVLYRLHTSRFKILLRAFRSPQPIRELAQREALRLTTKFWFGDQPTAESDDLAKSWAVLADIVNALAKCRLDHTFFHRSVYRHAQALMWAPVFCDPQKGYSEGSLGTVPATKSHQIRGLNNSTACAHSAEVIIGSLFEKKRPQLCSVWVTTSGTSPSPIEVLNESARKYDSIRGKYLKAYIESLALCERQPKLELLMQWVVSCKRDLPSHFQESARVRGGMIEKPHVKDPLLGSLFGYNEGILSGVKREVNKHLATFRLKAIQPKHKGDNNDNLKRSYACFLRLNVDAEKLLTKSAIRFNHLKLPEIEVLVKAFVESKDAPTLESDSTDWTGDSRKAKTLLAAVQHCKKAFPSLSQALYFRKKTRKAQNKSDNLSGAKRSLDETVAEFVVDVPSHLKEGDKFETTVKNGDEMTTIRLTVPPGCPSKLKFSLAPPIPEQASKRLKSDESVSVQTKPTGNDAKTEE